MSAPGPLELTLNEADAFRRANEIGLKVLAGQRAGLEPPRWFSMMLGVMVEVNRSGECGRQGMLLLVAAVASAFSTLPPAYRDAIWALEAGPMRLGGVVPDSLPADFENGKSSD